MGKRHKSAKTARSASFDWFTDDDPVDESTVESVAEAWGVKFPKKYVRIAAKYNGGSPIAESFTAFLKNLYEL
jgi:hypothetical protein